MAGSRIPGSLDSLQNNSRLFDSGTLTGAHSLPGPIGLNLARQSFGKSAVTDNNGAHNLNYPELNNRWKLMSSENGFKDIQEYLISIWLGDYYSLVGTAHTDVVQTINTGFSYLFDVFQERLIAAWGISKGKSNETRDKSRMKGHPKAAGKEYHRGHAIPHTLGGGTDINLVAQRGSINIGAFRVLEKKAVKTPGALYFSYWKYQNINTQIPARVQQGLLCPGQIADIRWHSN